MVFIDYQGTERERRAKAFNDAMSNFVGGLENIEKSKAREKALQLEQDKQDRANRAQEIGLGLQAAEAGFSFDPAFLRGEENRQPIDPLLSQPVASQPESVQPQPTAIDPILSAPKDPNLVNAGGQFQDLQASAQNLGGKAGINQGPPRGETLEVKNPKPESDPFLQSLGLTRKSGFDKKELKAAQDSIDKMRKEVSTLGTSKDLAKIDASVRKVQEAANDPSAAGDLALIFNYMKILDPGSVVRESEFATAQNAAGVPDRIRNVFNQVLKGQRLNPTQRSDFTRKAMQLAKAQFDTFQESVTPIRNTIEARQLPENQIIPQFNNLQNLNLPDVPRSSTQTIPSSIEAKQKQIQNQSDDELLKRQRELEAQLGR